MTDINTSLGTGAFGPEPEHDKELGTLLRASAGKIPERDVNWSALARRISTAIANQTPTPWWSYAARWERRAIPLALAAGIAGALTLWSASASASLQVSENPEFMSAVVSSMLPRTWRTVSACRPAWLPRWSIIRLAI